MNNLHTYIKTVGTRKRFNFELRFIRASEIIQSRFCVPYIAFQFAVYDSVFRGCLYLLYSVCSDKQVSGFCTVIIEAVEPACVGTASADSVIRPPIVISRNRTLYDKVAFIARFIYAVARLERVVELNIAVIEIRD